MYFCWVQPPNTNESVSEDKASVRREREEKEIRKMVRERERESGELAILAMKLRGKRRIDRDPRGLP